MLNADYREMLELLSAGGCDHLIVGAYALAIHGIPRATGDIDILIDPTPANAQAVHDALAAFGAPVGQIQISDLTTPGTVFQIGVAPCRIDVLTAIDGVTVADAIRGAVVHEVDGLHLRFLSRAHLIANKLASGRPQDLADVARLRESG